MASHARLLTVCYLVMLASLPPSSGAAISYVQGIAAVSTQRATQTSAIFPSTQSAGDLAVIFVAWTNPGVEVVSVSDTSGNLYLRAGAVSYAGFAAQAAYYANNIAAATPGRNSVKVEFSNPVDKSSLALVEYHGVDPFRPLELMAGAAGGSANPAIGPLATSNASDLLVASVFAAGRIPGPGPFYRQRLLAEDGSSIVEDNAITAAGSHSAATPESPAGWYLTQLLALHGACSEPGTRAPYPNSQLIAGIKWDFSTLLSHRKAIGSDIWPTTWAADDNLYAAWGDGGGFEGTERNKSTGRSSLGFARVNGIPDAVDAASVAGRNVWGQAPAFAEAQANFGGKVVDLISVNGVLYAQGGLWTRSNCSCADPTLKSGDNPLQRTLAWSRDLGKTWRVAPWASAADIGSSLQFGKDYAGAFDPAHLYIYYQRDVKRDAAHVYLRRVRSAEITVDPATPGHFEYWAGFENNTPRWSTTEAEAKAVFTDPNIASGTFAVASVVYDAPLHRYLLAAWHGPATGQVGFFEGQTPWGPWATIAYYEDWEGLNETAGEATGLSLPTKWISYDGRTLWAVFSGVNNGADNEFDSFNLVRGTLY